MYTLWRSSRDLCVCVYLQTIVYIYFVYIASSQYCYADCEYSSMDIDIYYSAGKSHFHVHMHMYTHNNSPSQTRQRTDIDGRIRLLEAEWARACDIIAEQEFNLVSTQNERVKLSPRAVEQGWSERLDEDVSHHRAAVTETKARALFSVSKTNTAENICTDVRITV